MINLVMFSLELLSILDEDKANRKNAKKDAENPDEQATTAGNPGPGPVRIRQSRRTRDRARPDYANNGEGRRPNKKKTSKKPKVEKS